VLEKSGAWFSYNGTRLANGRDKMRQYLKENPELMAELDKAIREKVKEKNNPRSAGDVTEGTDTTQE
jgi:recombination protein RecA